MINIKKYIMNISLILIISVLFTQNLDLFTQKITLENSLRDKIYSELERVLNKNKNRFYAWDFMQSLMRMIVILINGTG